MVGRLVIAQRGDHRAHLVEGFPADLGNAVQRVAGFLGFGLHQVTADAGLHRDSAKGVTDDVVQFPRDAEPFLA